MTKYRRKDPIVEAVQWFPPGDERHVPVDGVTPMHAIRIGDDGRPFTEKYVSGYVLQGREGAVKLIPGLWVLRTEDGSQSVMVEAEFEKSFVKVE